MPTRDRRATRHTQDGHSLLVASMRRTDLGVVTTPVVGVHVQRGYFCSELVFLVPRGETERPVTARKHVKCQDTRPCEYISSGQASANMAITSPPYAAQREYDSTSGFKPIPSDEYVEWFRAVAAGVESVLAPDGSYFLNIKAHADEGERNLYVMDLVLAHRRQWGWRFVDEFCWRKTDNGVPGGWQNRFKNAWEPVFHFCRQQQIKFRVHAVSHESEDCFDYSPDNPVWSKNQAARE